MKQAIADRIRKIMRTNRRKNLIFAGLSFVIYSLLGGIAIYMAGLYTKEIRDLLLTFSLDAGAFAILAGLVIGLFAFVSSFIWFEMTPNVKEVR